MNDATRTSLLLENDLYDRLKRSAKASRRSVHAQILTYVEDGLDRDDEVEQAVQAIRHAQEGSRSGPSHRELRPSPEEASPG